MEVRNQKIKTIHQSLLRLGFHILNIDEDRPWGGFFVIDPVDTKKFVHQFYPEIANDLLSENLPISPKILCVAPGKQLSWQYHHRRSELWKLIEGKAAYKKSNTDDEGDIHIMEINKLLTLKQGERHRLIGLNEWGTIAEIWKHTDANNPSNEEDIIRLQDDFGR